MDVGLFVDWRVGEPSEKLMAESPQKSKLFGPLQALLWAGLGTLLGAFINHYFVEKREVVQHRLEAYRTFAEGQARVKRSRAVRKEGDFFRAEELKDEGNLKVNESLYQIVYLGSRSTIESISAYAEAEAQHKGEPFSNCKVPERDKLDIAIYGSMRKDLRQAFTRTVCPYHTAIVLFKCKLVGPFCAKNDADCCEACSGISRGNGTSNCEP